MIHDAALASAVTLIALMVCGPLVYLMWGAAMGSYGLRVASVGVASAAAIVVVAVWADFLDAHWH